MFNPFKKKQDKNETKVLMACLYKSMLADGHTSHEESIFFWSMCREKGLGKEDIDDLISHCSSLSQAFPKDREKQKMFLSELVTMMKIDGAIKPEELELLKECAKTMGLAEADLPPLV